MNNMKLIAGNLRACFLQVKWLIVSDFKNWAPADRYLRSGLDSPVLQCLELPLYADCRRTTHGKKRQAAGYAKQCG